MDIDTAIKVTKERAAQQSSALGVLRNLPVTVDVATVEGGDVWIKAKGLDDIRMSVAGITSLQWYFSRIELLQGRLLLRFKHPDLNGNQVGMVIDRDDVENLVLAGLDYA